MKYRQNQFFFSFKMEGTVTGKRASRYLLRRYYRRFFNRRWNTSTYSYQHFKISIGGFIKFSESQSVALPPQITFLPDTSTLSITYTIYEVISLSPRYQELIKIFDNIKIHSAAIKVCKNVGVINEQYYQPNSLYFGFFYSSNNSQPTYDMMVGSDMARLINYNGTTRWYCRFKSKLLTVRELGDSLLAPLRLGVYSNVASTTQAQPTFNFTIDFYVTFNNCKV